MTQTKLNFETDNEEHLNNSSKKHLMIDLMFNIQKLQILFKKINNHLINVVNANKNNGNINNKDEIKIKVNDRIIKNIDSAEIAKENNIDEDFLKRMFNC